MILYINLSAVERSVYYHRILLLVVMIAVDLSCLQQHRDIGCGGGWRTAAGGNERELVMLVEVEARHVVMRG